MSKEFYIAPAGSGTSGSGRSRNNPIFGNTSVNNNAIGAVSGDTLIFLSGVHYEQLVVPVDGLRLVSDNDGAIWDGTTSLNGVATVASGHVIATTGNPWVLYSAPLNIWKKGVISAPYLFMDDVLLYPMNSSILTQSLANIDNLADNQYTLRTETTGSSTVTLYLKLPTGETPEQHDIRTTYRWNPASSTNTGMIEAHQKTGLIFEGQFTARRCNHSNGRTLPIWLDRCVGVSNPNGLLHVEHFLYGINISGGGDIVLKTSGRDSAGAHVMIGLMNNITVDSSYNGGSVTIKEWNAVNCGSIFDFTAGQVAYDGDMDGGVGVGYAAFNHSRIEILDGSSVNCGPQYDVQDAGWRQSTSTRGASVFVGTVNTGYVGDLIIARNRSSGCNKMDTMINTSASCTYGKVSVIGNFAKDVRHQTRAGNHTTENAIFNVQLGGTGQASIEVNLCDNVVSGGSNTRSSYEVYLTGGAAASTVNVCNNIAVNNPFDAAFPNNYGWFWNRSALSGTVKIDGNITDRVDTYGRNVATQYANKAAWTAAGFDANGQNGTVNVASDGSVTAGTANPIGNGVKHWGSSPRPSGINGEPRPDEGLDVGCWQSTQHPFHPANL